MYIAKIYTILCELVDKEDQYCEKQEFKTQEYGSAYAELLKNEKSLSNKLNKLTTSITNLEQTLHILQNSKRKMKARQERNAEVDVVRNIETLQQESRVYGKIIGNKNEK